MTETTSPIVDADVASFSSLPISRGTLDALTKMGITTPTPIQAQALPVLLQGSDVVGQAKTGSGKTLAFGIPAIEFADARLRDVQVLVLVPTRELAVQVANVLQDLAAPKGLHVVTIFGGVGVGPQRLALKKGAHVVVGTPGRVLDLLNQGALWLNRVRFMVLDEADEMLDRGFAPDVERIISRTSPDRQTAMFSATLPEWVATTAAKHLIDPVTVAVVSGPEDESTIEHIAYDVPEDKVEVLKDLLDHTADGQVIVFGRTRRGVARMAKRLERDGYPIVALQGDMAQSARDRVMDAFRSGRAPILIATNVAARGLDVSTVERVINFELPESSELLTHRIGRTGRMGSEGQEITLVGPEDVAKWRQLSRGMKHPIPRIPWPGAERAIAGGFTMADEPARPEERSGGRGRRPQPKPAAQRQAPPPRPSAPRSERPATPRPARPAATVAASNATQPPRQNRPSVPRPPRQSTARPADAPSTGGHMIICSGCKKTSIVPFAPDPSRPAFCR
ncbi:MAG: DEAD/DEAH box helicase, partial [Chloroflexota bacterium]